MVVNVTDEQNSPAGWSKIGLNVSWCLPGARAKGNQGGTD